ncbi:MAG: hypothetical protein Q9160_007948 [Pyrenula sp. 1 TL-2023]
MAQSNTAAKRNPAFQMLGMPNFRFKLPSRNWMIFLTVTGSFATAITYDRRQKKALQQKWCNLVKPMASEPLPTNELRRKMTIILAAPPGDSLGVSRRYFKEYIKPVLVAASLDYEVIEGRREGEVRYGVAEHIRKKRRKLENLSDESDHTDVESIIAEVRSKNGIKSEHGIQGDLVVGRQAWKEYIRGLHEGWLGPLEPPNSKSELKVSPATPDSSHSEQERPIEQSAEPDATDSSAQSNGPEASDSTSTSRENDAEERFPPPAYLSVDAYETAPLSSNSPATFEPSSSVPHPHILGFLNTPIRIYRFLNQRYLADEIGRQTAAAVLGLARPYDSSSPDVVSDVSPRSTPQGEQIDLLHEEERQWHKSVWKPKEDDSERVWLDNVVLDPRIGERMRKFVLDETL